MPSCAAINCSKQQIKGTLQSFHLFPHSQPELLKQWVHNMHRERFAPSKKSVVCSDHFQPNCFDRTGQTVRLRPGSVPTIFTLPDHLVKVVKSRKPPKERLEQADTAMNTQVSECCIPSTSSSITVHEMDHSYSIQDSPKSMKRKMDAVVDRAIAVQKRLKCSNAKVQRLRRRVKSLSEIVSALKKNDMISSSCEKLLESTFSGVSQLIMKRIMKQKSSRPTHSSYPEELKSFAMTLAFYSLKAYNYVRRTFHLALPHPSTLRQWYQDCHLALTAETEMLASVGSQFIALKNRGGLVKPSESVIMICEETEKCFQRMHTALGDKLPQAKHFVPTVCTVVLSEVGLNCFACLNNHMFDSTPDNNHVFNLIKCISSCYCTIRMHHLAKQKTVQLTGPLIRKQLTKLVLFKNQ